VVQFGAAPNRSRRVSRTRLRRRNAGGRFGLDSNSELQVGEVLQHARTYIYIPVG
jgi:hypothetical protein